MSFCCFSQVTENDVIEEEEDSEGEDRLCPKDQDFDSLAFERDLEEKGRFSEEQEDILDESDGDEEDLEGVGKPDLSYKIELFDEIHAELVDVKRQNQDYQDTLLVKVCNLCAMSCSNLYVIDFQTFFSLVGQ